MARISPGQISMALSNFGGMFAQSPQQQASAQAAHGMAQGLLAEEYRKQIERAQRRQQRQGLGQTLGTVAGSVAGSMIPIPGVGSAAGAALGGVLGAGASAAATGANPLRAAAVQGVQSLPALGQELQARGQMGMATPAGPPDVGGAQPMLQPLQGGMSPGAANRMVNIGQALQSPQMQQLSGAAASALAGPMGSANLPTAPAGLDPGLAGGLRQEVMQQEVMQQEQARMQQEQELAARQMQLREQVAEREGEAHAAQMARMEGAPTLREAFDTEVEQFAQQMEADRERFEQISSVEERKVDLQQRQVDLSVKRFEEDKRQFDQQMTYQQWYAQRQFAAQAARSQGASPEDLLDMTNRRITGVTRLVGQALESATDVGGFVDREALNRNFYRAAEIIEHSDPHTAALLMSFADDPETLDAWMASQSQETGRQGQGPGTPFPVLSGSDIPVPVQPGATGSGGAGLGALEQNALQMGGARLLEWMQGGGNVDWLGFGHGR